LFYPSRSAPAGFGLSAALASFLVLITLLIASPSAAQSAGEYLARAGDCVACHSLPGGRAFAGGLQMATPVGTIVATNITPDPETGIGRYSLAEFGRALREGVARDGHHLYPAMPYPSYARITDADVKALYEYFMHEVPPVRQANVTTAIPGHLAARWQMSVWNLVYAPSLGFTPDASKDARWNRGAYLVEGLGHCGACHTPRGWGMQESSLDAGGRRFLAGARIDDWYAPSLRGEMATGIGAWSASEIATFLKTGHNDRASAYGTMSEVITNSTSHLTDDDLAAMASYLKSLPARETQKPWSRDNGGAPPSAVYAAACATCHRDTGAAAPPYVPPLAGNPTVLDEDPASLINIVLNGSAPLVAKGVPDAYRMPQLREQLSDREIAEAVNYIRTAWGNHAPKVSPEAVAELRRRTAASTDRVVLLRMK